MAGASRLGCGILEQPGGHQPGLQFALSWEITSKAAAIASQEDRPDQPVRYQKKKKSLCIEVTPIFDLFGLERPRPVFLAHLNPYLTSISTVYPHPDGFLKSLHSQKPGMREHDNTPLKTWKLGEKKT